jgi:NADPH:quinone reductase-like Zn-dependent oxidoreductase
LLQGTGGVSIFSLLFAKIIGAKTIITSSSDEKLAKAKELGADHLINYKNNENWGLLAKEITQERGVDAIVEVGGAKTLSQSIQAIKMGGRIMLIGVLSGFQENIDLIPLLMNHVRVQGILVGSKSIFKNMNRVVSHSGIKPVIDKIFNFNEANEAFTYLKSGKHFGKICIKISAD